MIDGRNRLAACKLCGVKPVFEKLNGKDPLAYIVSANLNRRNLSKGQQAMAYAMVYPDRYVRKDKQNLPFSKMRVSQARSVLRHSEKLAKAVLAGTPSLNEALETVKTEEGRLHSAEAQLKRLRPVFRNHNFASVHAGRSTLLHSGLLVPGGIVGRNVALKRN